MMCYHHSQCQIFISVILFDHFYCLNIFIKGKYLLPGTDFQIFLNVLLLLDIFFTIATATISLF